MEELRSFKVEVEINKPIKVICNKSFEREIGLSEDISEVLLTCLSGKIPWREGWNHDV